MARPGFYTVDNVEIRFGRDGRWYADGHIIENRRIANLFSQHIERTPEGTYVLRIADERAPICVEDTAYVVVSVTVDRSVGTAQVELSDQSVETLDLGTLHVGADEVLYCQVKSGSERARFLRPAYYQMAAYIREGERGRFVLQLGDRAHPVERREGA